MLEITNPFVKYTEKTTLKTCEPVWFSIKNIWSRFDQQQISSVGAAKLPDVTSFIGWSE